MKKSLISRIFSDRVFPILLVNFLGILGYSVVIPILIFVVTKFGGNAFVYGIVGAAYPFFQFLGAPRLGKLSDRIGRKRVLIITQIGSFLAWMLFLLSFELPRWTLWEQESSVTGAYSITLPLVFVVLARAVDGFTGGNISVANAYMADVSDEESRGKNFGLIGASTSLGFIVGPAMAGVLSGTELEERLVLIASAAMALFTALIIHLKLKETVPGTAPAPGNIWKNIKGMRNSLRPYVEKNGSSAAQDKGPGRSEILRIPGMPALFAIYFLSFFSFSLYYVSLPIFASEVLNWDVGQLGLFLAFFSLMMVLVQGPLLSVLSSSVHRRTLVLVGAPLTALGFGLVTRGEISFLYAGAVFMALGNGLMWPSFLNVLGSRGDNSIQGSIQGYGASMGSIARMSGLIAGGLLFEFWETDTFFLSGAMYGLIFLISLKYCR